MGLAVIGSLPSGGSNRVTFQPNTNYRAGDTIIHAGKQQYATQDFRSAGAYSSGDWTNVPASDPDASANLATKADLVGGKVPGSQLPAGNTPAVVVPFYIAGDLAVGTGKGQFMLPTDAQIQQCWATAGTAPDNRSAIFDVNKNGSTIFTTQGNRPAIPAAQKKSGIMVPDTKAAVAGDIFTIDVDQVGNASSGGPPTFFSDTIDSASSGDSTSHIISPPSGVAVGDIWIISLQHNSADLNTPTGLTLLDSVGTGSNKTTRFYRLITGTEAATYTFTSSTSFLGTTGGGARARHIVYRGVDQTTPIDQHDIVTGSSATGTATLTPAGALTTALSNAVLLYTLAMPSTQSKVATGPSGGYTVRTGFTGAASTRHLADKNIVAGGTYGAESIDLVTGGVSTRWYVGRLILKGTSGGGAFEMGKDAQIFLRYTEG